MPKRWWMNEICPATSSLLKVHELTTYLYYLQVEELAHNQTVNSANLSGLLKDC